MQYKFKLFLFNIVLLIILTEIAIRLSGVYTTYSEKNFNRFESYYGKKITTRYFIHPPNKKIINEQNEFNYIKYSNSMGLINEEIKPKQSDTKRIIILGDSFIEGIGTPQDSCMPILLNKILLQKTKNKFEVINAGIVGSDVFFEYELLKDKLLKLQPDIVLLNINYSDFSDYAFRGGMERYKEDGTIQFKDAPNIEKFYRYSHLFRAVIHFVFNYDFTLLSKKEFYKVYSKANKEILQTIQLANDLCISNKTEFIVCLQPYPFSYVKKIPGYSFIDSLNNSLLNTNIQFINTYKSFDEILNKNNYLQYSWEKDGHFNSNGYKLFAEIIYSNTEKKYPHIWKLKHK